MKHWIASLILAAAVSNTTWVHAQSGTGNDQANEETNELLVQIFDILDVQQNRLQKIEEDIAALQASGSSGQEQSGQQKDGNTSDKAAGLISELTATKARLAVLENVLARLCGANFDAQACQTQLTNSQGSPSEPENTQITKGGDDPAANNPSTTVKGYTLRLDQDGLPQLLKPSAVTSAVSSLPIATECSAIGPEFSRNVKNRQENAFFVTRDRASNNRSDLRVCKLVQGAWHVLPARNHQRAHLLEIPQ